MKKIQTHTSSGEKEGDLMAFIDKSWSFDTGHQNQQEVFFE